jgi:hypothetical protein
VLRLAVMRTGWTVDAAIRNRTHATLLLSRRVHRPRQPDLGLVVTRAPDREPGRNTLAMYATQVSPPLPRSLAPGAGWSGRFSGTRPLVGGTYVRVLLGRFSHVPAVRGFPPTWSWVTDNRVRV